jgi:P27 family predicted phage terminase small subunit
MGRRGPRPAPVELKLLRGETRPSRVNYRAPKPLRNLPTKPANLTAGAEPTWDLVIGELGPTGVLTAVDGLVLRILAEAAARYESASTALAASGPLIRGARGGELIRNPLHQIVRDNATLVLLLARELGATPSARAGLRAPAAETGGRLAAFLAENRGG